jgi:hypothetical protein
VKVVKILVAFGANGCAANGQGVFPYQLASSKEVKDIIKDVIGDAAVKQQQESYSKTPAGSEDSPRKQAAAADEEEEEEEAVIKSPAQKVQSSTKSPAQLKPSPSLHSGAMLGELPHLPTSDSKRNIGESSNEAKRSSSNAEGSGRKSKAPPVPEGFPKHLLCAICEQPLKDPVLILCI